MEPRWIPVGERLPEPHHHVIGWQPDFARTAEVWIGSSGQWLGGDFEPAGDITHWMPLPEPPAITRDALREQWDKLHGK